VVGEFFRLFSEEAAWGQFEAGARKHLPMIFQELDKGGAIDKYIQIASNGGSIWRSALPRPLKKQMKEALAVHQQLENLLKMDSARAIDIVLESIPTNIREKIDASVPREYWVKELTAAVKESVS